jgi:hypothetical protein
MMETLERVKTALTDIPGITTLKIGLEANLTAADYPILRIVPGRAIPSQLVGARQIELTIYLGLPIQPFDDTPDDDGRVRLEKLYAALFDLEAQVISALATIGCRYTDSILDEDRVDAYKLLAVRARVEG